MPIQHVQLQYMWRWLHSSACSRCVCVCVVSGTEVAGRWEFLCCTVWTLTCAWLCPIQIFLVWHGVCGSSLWVLLHRLPGCEHSDDASHSARRERLGKRERHEDFFQNVTSIYSGLSMTAALDGRWAPFCLLIQSATDNSVFVLTYMAIKTIDVEGGGVVMVWSRERRTVYLFMPLQQDSTAVLWRVLKSFVNVLHQQVHAGFVQRLDPLLDVTTLKGTENFQYQALSTILVHRIVRSTHGKKQDHRQTGRRKMSTTN